MFKVMQSEEMLEILNRIGMSQADLSRNIGKTPQTVSGWVKGRVKIDNAVAAYLRYRVAVQRSVDGLDAASQIF